MIPVDLTSRLSDAEAATEGIRFKVNSFFFSIRGVSNEIRGNTDVESDFKRNSIFFNIRDSISRQKTNSMKIAAKLLCFLFHFLLLSLQTHLGKKK